MAISSDRINNDVNGNPRYVVHFHDLLTEREKASSFLSWAGAKYTLAQYRASSVGGKQYKAKSYGGGLVFTSYNLQHELQAAFDLFAQSADYKKASVIAAHVLNDEGFKAQALQAMGRVYDRKFLAAQGFASVQYVASNAASGAKLRASFKALYIAASLVVLGLEGNF